MIDLYSDTKTRPTPAMRAAIAAAEVGDEQKEEDSTVNALCERLVALTGKEAAIFLPSGTMANQIAIRVHCGPGDEVFCDRSAHVFCLEGGGASALSGVTLNLVEGERGVFTGEQLAAALHPDNRFTPHPRLVVVEQTSNRGGGRIWPEAVLSDVGERARAAGLATHMDGARIFNAQVASGVTVKDFCRHADSVYVDFTKGLGAPVGACLAGSKAFIRDAWKWKQMWGGSMRQAGIVAAGALYALDHHIERLADDHRRAKRFAEEIARVPGVRASVDAVETNIVMFEVDPALMAPEDLVERLVARNVRVGLGGPGQIRAVTHLDIGDDDIASAAASLAEVLKRS